MANKRVTETQILKNDVVKAYAKTNEDIQNLQIQIDTLQDWIKLHLNYHGRLVNIALEEEKLEKNA